MLRTASLAAAAAFFTLPALACDGFAVHDPYAIAATAMSQSGAAFMTFQNAGTADCRVVAVRSDIAQRTELHTHIASAEGVMRMVRIEGGIAVPAGSEHELARGADHVMFLGLTRPMAQGEVIQITLEFEDGSEYAFEAPVDLQRMMGGAQMQGQGQMQGHGQGHGPSN